MSAVRPEAAILCIQCNNTNFNVNYTVNTKCSNNQQVLKLKSLLKLDSGDTCCHTVTPSISTLTMEYPKSGLIIRKIGESKLWIVIQIQWIIMLVMGVEDEIIIPPPAHVPDHDRCCCSIIIMAHAVSCKDRRSHRRVSAKAVIKHARFPFHFLLYALQNLWLFLPP